MQCCALVRLRWIVRRLDAGHPVGEGPQRALGAVEQRPLDSPKMQYSLDGRLHGGDQCGVVRLSASTIPAFSPRYGKQPAETKLLVRELFQARYLAVEQRLLAGLQGELETC